MHYWQIIKLLILGTWWGRCTSFSKGKGEQWLDVSFSIKRKNKWYSVSVKSKDESWDCEKL